MSKLTDREQALLDAARKGWCPSPKVMRSVRAGIPERLREEPTFGADAPGPRDVASSVGRLEAAKAFVRSPWGGAVTGLGVLGLCVAFGMRGPDGDRAAPPPPAVAPTSAVAPASPSPPQIAEPSPSRALETVTLEPPPEAPQPPSLDRRGDRVGAAAKAARASSNRPAPVKDTDDRRAGTDTIAEEVALVRTAQRALRDGAPAEALASLATHASRFPNGALREERMTLQVLSLCATGDLAKARSVRAELERLAPASSHLQRLSCAAAPAESE